MYQYLWRTTGFLFNKLNVWNNYGGSLHLSKNADNLDAKNNNLKKQWKEKTWIKWKERERENERTSLHV